MLEQFQHLADDVTALARADEMVLANFAGEDSDFVRLNRNRIRQSGSVRQGRLNLELIRGRRHASESIPLSGQRQQDLAAARDVAGRLRAMLDDLPDDPYLLVSTDVRSGEQIGRNRLTPAEQVLDEILTRCEGRDLVGILAQGGIYRGFANSLGQRNWFSAHSFHFDWCFYLQADKAVKNSYGGFAWDSDVFAGKVEQAGRQLEILARPPRTIPRGRYRAYLAPAALEDFVGALGYGGFGLKGQKTRTTSLLKMHEGQASLSPAVTICENTAEGMAPNFQAQGFVRPDRVTLVEAGRLADPLVSPRSAQEYGVATNGANGAEMPESLDMAAGSLPQDEVLQRLGEGLLVNNVWYLNYSDRPGCRITGMTRFATFWVEGGRIAAPIEVMRFDDTPYNLLGEGLVDLTREREFIPSSSTYGGRSTASARVPGALVEGMQFTL